MKTSLVCVLIFLLAGSTAFLFSPVNFKIFSEDPAFAEKTTEVKKEFSKLIGWIQGSNELKKKLGPALPSVYFLSPTTVYYLFIPSGNTTETFLSFHISKMIYPFHSFL